VEHDVLRVAAVETMLLEYEMVFWGAISHDRVLLVHVLPLAEDMAVVAVRVW